MTSVMFANNSKIVGLWSTIYQTFYTKDGTTWFVTNADATLSDAFVMGKSSYTFLDGYFYISTGGNTAGSIYKTKNFIAFTLVSTPTIDLEYTKIFTANGKLYLVGRKNTNDDYIDLFESSDFGLTWSFNKTIFSNANLSSVDIIETSEKVFVSINSSYTTVKTAIITKTTLGVTTSTNSYVLDYTQNFYPNVGTLQQRYISGTEYTDANSSTTNLIQFFGTTNIDTGYTLQKVCYNKFNSKYYGAAKRNVATSGSGYDNDKGYYQIYTSNDGTNWSLVYSSNAYTGYNLSISNFEMIGANLYLTLQLLGTSNSDIFSRRFMSYDYINFNSFFHSMPFSETLESYIHCPKKSII